MVDSLIAAVLVSVSLADSHAELMSKSAPRANPRRVEERGNRHTFSLTESSESLSMSYRSRLAPGLSFLAISLRPSTTAINT